MISIFATVGRTAELGIDATTNQAIVGLIPKVNGFDKKYVRYYLDSQDENLIDKSRGVAQNNINKAILSDVEIPLPDLKTQQEIAHVLEQADKARQQRKAANALTDHFLQSSFLFLFGDPVKNEKGWEVKKLEEVCSKITDGKHGDCNDESNSGYYFISAKDLVDGTINYNGVREITKEDFEETDKRTRLQINDVLIGNTGASIGKIGIVKDLERTRRTTFQKSIAIVTTDSKLFLPDFLMAYFLANNTILEKISSGSGQKNLLLFQLRNYEMIIPPLSLQQQFAVIVTQVEELRQKQRESERELEGLFQSLLQRYFG